MLQQGACVLLQRCTYACPIDDADAVNMAAAAGEKCYGLFALGAVAVNIFVGTEVASIARHSPVFIISRCDSGCQMHP
jgi:hypothetical protein